MMAGGIEGGITVLSGNHIDLAKTRALRLMLGASVLALSCSHAFAQSNPSTAADQGVVPTTLPTAQDIPAAQSDPATTAAPQGEDAVNDVIVTGIRASLASSQNLKRNADTVVDAITAQDIGALPDRSVTEALQRVPGISISRFAAGNDSDHFSIEGSGIVIRGLNYVRSEFNGRDSFSVNGGRALNFQDVSPELLGSVEVYKNLTPDMIEGGIAGTVNLNTRKPFDSKDPVFYVSADMNYSDLIKKGSPSISGLYSRNFDTGAGRFGILVGASYSQLFSRSDGVQVTNFQQRFNGTNAAGQTDNFPGLAPGEVVYAPVGAGIRSEEHDRERIGASAALQFESLDHSLLATLQFVRTDARETWGEHTFETQSDGIDRATYPAAGTRYSFDDDGVFESGTITYDRGYTPTNGQQFGMNVQLSNRGVKTRSVTDDYGANVKWTPTDRLSFNFDGQYIDSTSKQTDFSFFGGTFANVDLDITGARPQVTFLPPDGSDPNTYYADPSHSYYRAAMDHFEDNNGHEMAFRADGEYQLGDGFLKKVKFGARYADRDQTVRYSLYNWGAMSEVWAGTGAVYFDQANAPYENHYFDNFFRGTSPIASAPYGVGNPAEDYDRLSQQAVAINKQWQAMGGPAGFVPAAARAGVLAGTPFLPSEVYSNREQTTAAYARVDFGSDTLVGDLRFSGNFGLRYVRTVDKADGFFTFPTRSQIIGNGDPATFCADPAQTSAFCTLTPQQRADVLTYSDGTAINQTTRNAFEHWLPSFNLKVGITPKLITRFAYSKAISRPGFEQLQSTIQIAPQNGVSVFQLQASSRNANPNLRPVEANQFDLTAEWYFASVGSLTAAVFYKDLKNIIVANVAQTRQVTNNGITQDILFVGPQNASGHGNIKGAEIAYQQTFTFLPGLLSGLGVEANYTYVENSGIPQSRGAATPTTTVVDYGDLPLEGLSKHTVNGTVFYERGPLSARAAYSWRSSYLLTVRDEVVPNLPIMSDAFGQLDGSVIYSVTDGFKIGIQGVNLLNGVTKTRTVIGPDSLTAPRTYFVNDRRFTLTTRMKF